MTWAKKPRPYMKNKGKRCKYPGCDSHAYVKGYCSQHCRILYKKVKKNVSKS
jgi:hypothetical protein